ncbi:MAG: LuxR C-terminal-related transcriptional regulator [Solirubrobacteraceae bacterium]
MAERLVLSPKTIERHMEHIFAKLGVSLSGAVARLVLRHHTSP